MNTMTASMSFKGLKVSLEADRELTFKEIFKLHQLVTGNDDELNVEDDGDSKPTDSSVSDIPDYGEQVNTDIECPFCGYTSTRTSDTVPFGFHFIKCPKCAKKLFLSYATANRGVPNEKGFYYIADREFHDRRSSDTSDEYSKMFAHNDNPDIPDAYSTIPEIKDYLDRQGIDYTGARLKGQLLELIPSKQEG